MCSGAGQVAQANLSQVAQRDVAGQAAPDQHRHGLRQQDLAAMRRIGDARGPVHRAAEKIIVAALGRTRMQSAADAQRDPVGGRGIREHLLNLQHRDDGVDRVIERRMDAVTTHLHDDAPMALDGVAGNLVMASQRKAHPLVVTFPELAAAFDVRKEKGGDGRQDFHAMAPFHAFRWT